MQSALVETALSHGYFAYCETQVSRKGELGQQLLELSWLHVTHARLISS